MPNTGRISTRAVHIAMTRIYSARVYADELQNIKPYRDLAEGDEHYGEVGFAHFAEDVYEQMLRPDEGVLVLLGDIALYHRGGNYRNRR